MTGFLLLLVLSILPVVSSQAQTPRADDWQDLLMQVMEDCATEDDEAAENLQDLMDELQELASHPINLNQATEEQLQRLPFLDKDEREALLTYLFRYAPMRSLGELRLIRSLDAATIALLPYFVYIDPAETLPDSLRLLRLPDQLAKPPRTFSRPRRYAEPTPPRHEVTASAAIPLYQRKGYRQGYLGYPVRHWLRYAYSNGQWLRFGLQGAQEAGEPFFANKNGTGYDHYGAYLMWQGAGLVRRVVAGDYKLALGMGLTAHSGIRFGKTAATQSLTAWAQPLRPHTTRSESQHLRGVGATFRLGRQWQATVFASTQLRDATLWDDGSVRTFLESNPHRTQTAMSKRHNTRQSVEGGSARWTTSRVQLAANAVWVQTDRPLSPGSKADTYRKYAPKGKRFANYSVDYSLRLTRGILKGEVALNQQGAVAAIHQVQWNVAPGLLRLSAIHRYYDRRYTTLLGQAFGEGSTPQNEHGLYLSALWQPSTRWQAEWYADYAHFPWKRYLVSMPSDAFDTQFQTRYEHGAWLLNARYRLHIKQRDDPAHTLLRNQYTQRASLCAELRWSSALKAKLRIDATAYRFDSQRQLGGMVSANVDYNKTWWRLTAQAGYFCTDGYYARLFQYEPSTTGNASFPTYYGRGWRALAQGQTTLGRWRLMLRYALTHYTDRSTVGTGLQQVDSPTLGDLQMAIRYAFR